MNHLQNLAALKNRYFIMRHGKSEGNVRKIIVSHPAHGTINFGLTDEGKEAVITSVLQAKNAGLLDSSVIIYSSDFTRTRQTAEIAAATLGSNPVTLSTDLRERFFGDHDGKASDIYETIWQRDNLDIEQKIDNVESVLEVIDRTSRLVAGLEDKYENKTILLVSHGDPIQMLMAAFEKIDLINVHSLSYLKTAEIRELILK